MTGPRLTAALVTAVAVALAVTAVASASRRMPIGFHDDASFRWSETAPLELDRAAAAHATVIRTVVEWRAVAPVRPRRPAQPFDPAYRLDDVDELVRSAQRRGIEVMITIWGTPRWANRGRPANVAPRRAGDLTSFARALASRYSGRYEGYPYVGRFSIWNEPNLGIFLSPQFDKKRRIVGPKNYARLYRAAYKGIKAGNRSALVAIGETSNQGRDHPLRGAHDSVAPATFARLLARERGLRFDAYATHPYSTRPSLPPTQKVRWPNVTLSRLKQFERSLDRWFHRRDIPVWITEYGYETRPAERSGVTPAKQARYLSSVVRQLRADPRVGMFIWFIFRDSRHSLWQSGLYSASGHPKRAYRTFTALARATGGDSKRVRPRVQPTMVVPVPALAFTSTRGTAIDVAYSVFLGPRRVARGQARPRLTARQSVSFRLRFRPVAGKTYTVVVAASNDAQAVTTTYELKARGAAPKP
jgi:hypothetical protein